MRIGAFAVLAFGVGLSACEGEMIGSSNTDIRLPPDIVTYPDGRLPIEALFSAYSELERQGWQLDVIAASQPDGTEHALPIIALRTPRAGPAIWILAGIHGEEPAGPNAIADAIDDIAALGIERPVVLLPLCNPHGYVRNWRYLNTAVYSTLVDGQSVGDSSHWLPVSEAGGRARAPAASSAEADAVTRYIVERASDYPPRVSIDLHEDNLIDEGYVYSQGQQGEHDPLAIAAVRVLRDNAIPIKMSGRTRFDEEIAGGIIGPVTDSSVDELMSAKRIIVDGGTRPGPAAKTVLVFETPAAAVTLDRRKAAHSALIRRLASLVSAAGD